VNRTRIRGAFLIFVLAGAMFASGCGSPNVEGTYHDPENAVTLELKSGKASLNFAMIHMNAAYTVDGDKLTLRPLEGDASQTMVFTINKDGSLSGPAGSMIPRLVKAK